MLNWVVKGEKLVLRLAALAGAIMGLYAFWLFLKNPSEQSDPAPPPPIPAVTACDSRSEPVAERILGSLARLDCTLAEIRVCDFDEAVTPAADTSHGMPAHMMRLSVEIDGERLPVIGNGRGETASQAAFDSLFNNLKQVLEDKDLCR
ncbi:MAG: hypothetical protein ACK5JR_08185 [Tropicimonas sp.]|uniref:hypothetical protein n=1 Tax=Tropicimonas sp. TaxID=2067044 RepID=UPI003A87B097